MHHLRRFLSHADRQRFYRQGFVRGKSEYPSNVEAVAESGQKPQFTIPPGLLGQATCFTHPHMVPKGHLTCGISQAEYRERRETLVSKLAAEVDNMHKTHIIVIPAARKQYMSDKIPFVFRQNSDFFYLTGCLEPSAILLMIKPAQVDTYKSILFVHEKDTRAELWEGPRTGCANSTELFAVDESRPVETFGSYLNKITLDSKPSVLWYHNESPSNPDIHQTVRSVIRQDSQTSLQDPQTALHFMRVIKSPAEIELMKETCNIGAQSINTAMACTRPGVTEHEINAVLDYSCRLQGAEHLAFPPVVGGGARATHIHYVTNNQVLHDGDMLLVDSGTQRWLYNSDISRTWPVSGKFSKYHRILYELVLSVQKRLIEILAEHHPPLDLLFDHMCRLLGVQLQAEGILSKDIDSRQVISEAFRLCPHHVSHYLGLDVHDSPRVRRGTALLPRMVVTVEPGIYIRPDDEKVPPEFRGVGIRVEDDVLVTESGALVLTSACAKEIEDIEAIVGKNSLK